MMKTEAEKENVAKKLKKDRNNDKKQLYIF